MGQKQKTERENRGEERLNDGNNNGQAMHGARKHACRAQVAWAKTNAGLKVSLNSYSYRQLFCTIRCRAYTERVGGHPGSWKRKSKTVVRYYS